MKNINLHSFSSIALLCFCLVSCGTPITKPEGCPASFADYAYGGSSSGSAISMPENWRNIVKIPTEIKFPSLEIAIIRNVSNQTEIWLKGPDSNAYLDRKSENYKYYTYTVEKKEWREISAVVENTNAFAMRLFLFQDGTIWAQNFWDVQKSIGNSTQKYPILSKYNDSKQTFELVPETQGIQAYNSLNLSWNKIFYSGNIFWIISQGDSIYSYDPDSLKITKHIEIPNLEIDYVTSSKDTNDIYLQTEHGISFAVKKGEYLQFSPENNTLVALDLPTGMWWPDSGSILVDHNGNLWLSAVGQRKPDGNWSLLYPNPLLFFWEMQVDGNYSYQLPDIILESADGRLWFSGEKGVAWLEPMTGQGCWFTHENTNIVEDKNKSLWIIIDRTLNKLTN